MTLDEEPARPFEIWTGDVEMRADQMARVDLVLQAEVGVRLDAAGGAHRRDAVREIEPGGAERHLRDDERLFRIARRLDVRPLQVEQVIMHPDDAGHHRFAGSIDDGVIGSDWRAGRLDCGDPGTIDEDGLILDRCRAGSVDNSHMSERDVSCRHANEWLDIGPERGRRRQNRRGGGNRAQRDHGRSRQQAKHHAPSFCAQR